MNRSLLFRVNNSCVYAAIMLRHLRTSQLQRKEFLIFLLVKLHDQHRYHLSHLLDVRLDHNLLIRSEVFSYCDHLLFSQNFVRFQFH